LSEHSVRAGAGTAIPAEPKSSRALILDAAVRLIGRDGVAQVKSAAVAKEAGVSVGLVHYHFATLGQLAREAFLYADAITLRAMAEAVGAAASGREEIDLRLLAWLDASDEFQQAWEIWAEFWHASRHDDEVRALLHDCWEEWVELIAEAVERGRRDGSIASGIDPVDAARRLAALLESLGQQLTTGLIAPRDARRLLRGAIEMELPA
jgi:TetR/AcrR family transcriptional repressor of bet genes